jgi:hypothetical protein
MNAPNNAPNIINLESITLFHHHYYSILFDTIMLIQSLVMIVNKSVTHASQVIADARAMQYITNTMSHKTRL